MCSIRLRTGSCSQAGGCRGQGVRLKLSAEVTLYTCNDNNIITLSAPSVRVWRELHPGPGPDHQPLLPPVLRQLHGLHLRHQVRLVRGEENVVTLFLIVTSRAPKGSKISLNCDHFHLSTRGSDKTFLQVG